MTNKEKAELFLSNSGVRVIVTMPAGTRRSGIVANYPVLSEDDTDDYKLHPDWNRVRVKLDEQYAGHCSPELDRVNINDPRF
jgi:hypothetical protein